VRLVAGYCPEQPQELCTPQVNYFTSLDPRQAWRIVLRICLGWTQVPMAVRPGNFSCWHALGRLAAGLGSPQCKITDIGHGRDRSGETAEYTDISLGLPSSDLISSQKRLEMTNLPEVKRSVDWQEGRPSCTTVCASHAYPEPHRVCLAKLLDNVALLP
jgi:hypothetical protein